MLSSGGETGRRGPGVVLHQVFQSRYTFASNKASDGMRAGYISFLCHWYELFGSSLRIAADQKPSVGLYTGAAILNLNWPGSVAVGVHGNAEESVSWLVSKLRKPFS